jgi:hypothetical protein
MKPMELAVLNACSKKCAIKIFNALRVFKMIEQSEKVLIEKEIEKILFKYLLKETE